MLTLLVTITTAVESEPETGAPNNFGILDSWNHLFATFISVANFHVEKIDRFPGSKTPTFKNYCKSYRYFLFSVCGKMFKVQFAWNYANNRHIEREVIISSQ